MQNGKDENSSVDAVDEVRGAQHNRKANIILVGIMGSGKSTVAELLARTLGYGFLDVDSWIARREGQTIAAIFESKGEEAFRSIEKSAIAGLSDIRNHVISAGGGAVLDDDNWELFQKIATTVWIKTPPNEIARRIVMRPDEIRARPLIADLVNIEERMERQKQLQDRLGSLESQRASRYGRANIVVEHAYATPETCALFVKTQLAKHGAI